MKFAISYVRFSHPNQKLGDSARRQIENAQRYCAEHGLTLEDKLRDEGKSAYSGAHVGEDGALGGLLKAVREGRITRGTTLIVEAMDRLSREKVLDALRQFLELLRAGIAIVTLIDNHFYDEAAVNDNPMSLQYSIMTMALAHNESRNKSARLSETWIKKRRDASGSSKRPLSNMCPGWLTVIDGKFQVDEAKAEIINRIFEMMCGGYGAMMIARQLNTDRTPLIGTGLRTTNATSWGKSTVLYLVQCRKAEGLFQPHTGKGNARKAIGEPIEDYYPRIVSADLAARALEGLAGRRQAGSGQRGKVANLLAGLTKCIRCFGPMEFTQGGGKGRPDYLQCASAERNGGCTHKKRHLYKKVEMAVLDEMLTLAIDPPAIDNPAKDLIDRLAKDESFIKLKRTSVDRLTKALEDESDAPESIVKRIRELETDIRDRQVATFVLRREIETISATAPTANVYAQARQILLTLKDNSEDVAVRLAVRSSLRRVCDAIFFADGPFCMVVGGGHAMSFWINTKTGVIALRSLHFPDTTINLRNDATETYDTPTPEPFLRWQRSNPERFKSTAERLSRRMNTPDDQADL